jgi:hypothetical protein
MASNSPIEFSAIRGLDNGDLDLEHARCLLGLHHPRRCHQIARVEQNGDAPESSHDFLE